MLAEKQLLTLAELEAQTALELPERETPQTVFISCVAVCIGNIIIRDVSVAVGANICANVGLIANVINTLLLNTQTVELECTQRGNVTAE
jgi:hypothetical protein